MDKIIHPDPNKIFPIDGVTRTCFLKNIITKPQVSVGDYTYYDDPEDVYNFEKNVLYLFDFSTDKLVIGKYCQIATGVRFITNAANHPMNGASTYPFKAFGKSWGTAPLNVICKGDIVIGNDVWIGNSATIMQGVHIGDGAIIGTNALVTKNVEPYTIVGGNPAKMIRKRFDDKAVAFLMQLAWWDWPMDKIADNLDAISNGDLEVLKKIHT